MTLLALQLPDAEIVSGWEQVGIVGLLVALIVAAGWALGTERVVLGARFREIKDRSAKLEGEIVDNQKDFVRLTEAYERLGRDLISLAVRSGAGRVRPEEEKDHGRS